MQGKFSYYEMKENKSCNNNQHSVLKYRNIPEKPQREKEYGKNFAGENAKGTT